jgi:hypothetical protein
LTLQHKLYEVYGVWLLCLAAILHRADHSQFEWLLVAIAALHFGLASRLFRIARRDPDLRSLRPRPS